MKYLYVKPADRSRAAEDTLIPVNDELHIVRENGVAFLAIGNRLIFDLDKHNESEFIPFLADSFNRCDVVTVQLQGHGPQGL